jgi:hypothetical protein
MAVSPPVRQPSEATIQTRFDTFWHDLRRQLQSIKQPKNLHWAIAARSPDRDMGKRQSPKYGPTCHRVGKA